MERATAIYADKQRLRRTEFNLAGQGLSSELSRQPANWISVRLSLGRGLLLLVILAGVPGRVDAYSGDVFSRPQGGKPRNGLRLTVDTRWVDGNGYRPVRIEATNWPPGPALADRRISVWIEPDTWQSGRPVVRVSGQIEIPEGVSRGQAVLAVPQSDAWSSLMISTYEDGTLLKDLSGPVSQSGRTCSETTESVPSILIIDSDAPTRDVRTQQLSAGATTGQTVGPRRLPDVLRLFTLFTLWNPYDSSQLQIPSDAQLDDLATLRLLTELEGVELLPPSELPTRWLDYSCFDMVFISRSDLQMLTTSHPAAWHAIRDWAASGPTLCVYDMELSDLRLAELAALVEIRDAAGLKPDAAPANRWRAGAPKQRSVHVSALEERRKRYVERAEQGTMAGPNPNPKPPVPEAESDVEPQPFVVRPFYRGRIVAMQTDQPLATGTNDAAWLFNDLGNHTWMWYQRHGLSLQRTNDEYWNWLVPGIGRAPVGSFLILIAAFVVVIGPVNYFLLRRKRRLYLLLVTVPLGAAVVTFTLFGYALVSDGLGVRVRVRSFTELDQRTGHAVSWSRQSYYAGLAPSGGLTFPATAAVYPVDQYPGARRQGEFGTQWLVWGKAQNLASGYIRSRSTAQFLVVESGPNARGVSLEAGADAAEFWATNRLGATIDRLVVKDPQGRVLGTTQLAPGQRRRLDAINPGEARLELAQANGRHAPAYPPGFHPGFDASLFGGSYRYWNSVDEDLPNPTAATGILEQSLVWTLNSAIEEWPPRTYVALTSTSPGISLGCDVAREQASFHVVSGRW